VCTACGFDCSTLRAPPDPVYGLPLVVCPGCRRPSVRRELRVFWRRSSGGQVLWTLGALMLRALTLLTWMVAAIAMVALAASVIQAALAPTRSERPLAYASIAWNTAFGGTVLLAGTFLTALGLRWAMGHLSPRRRTIAYVALAAGLMWGFPNFFAAADALFTVGPRYGWNGVTHPAPPPFSFDIGHWLWPIMLAVVGALVWMFGGVADRFGRYTAQQAWLARLARARRRRMRRRS
jgi:hypothetical protein